MTHERVHALLSKATEAIVSEDGRVQRRINNYETVIGSDAEDPFFVSSGAVNDNYGNLSNEITIAGKRVEKVTVLRYAMYLAFMLAFLGFAWSLSFLFSSSQPQLHESTNDSEISDARSRSELQLERVANLIIRDGDWNDTRINLFIREWSRNNQEAKEILQNRAWYQHFSYRLKQKFREEQNIGEFAGKDNASSAHPIMKLALAMGIALPDVNYVALSNSKKEISELGNVVTRELTKLEQAKRTGQQTVSARASTDPAAAHDSDLMKKTGLASLKSSVNTPPAELKPPVNGKESFNAMPEPSISGADVNRVLEKYAAAYEQGDMLQMTLLFGVDHTEQGNQIIEQLKNNYETVFINSNKRDVSIDGVTWRTQGKRVVVDSGYRASLELKDNKGIQSVNASAKWELQLLNNELKIDRLELLNRKVNVVTPELKLSSTSRSVKPEGPTAAELQDIVTRLIGAYESGNIKMLASLFAKDAATNDRNGLKEIEEDYKRLFASTSSRQMFIQGIKWTHGAKYAKGSGDLEAIVFARSDEPGYSMKGKIQIVAKRIDDKVLITRLYHIERAK